MPLPPPAATTLCVFRQVSRALTPLGDAFLLKLVVKLRNLFTKRYLKDPATNPSAAAANAELEEVHARFLM